MPQTYDYQVLAFRDAAPLRKVGIYSSNPLTLDIRGRDFVAVAQVLINGRASPEFVVVSEKRILAQVPRSQQDARLRSVSVLLSKSGITDRTAIFFESVVPGAKASGFTRLLQSFLRLLFTVPGEDLHDSSLGGGMGRIVGAAGDPGELRAAAVQAVSDTEEQLIRLQSRNTALQDSERLQSATLLEAVYTPSTTSLDIRLRLTAMDGSTHDPVVSRSV